MIVGAMKCGTTTLADLMKAHPGVSFCREKEPEFFSKHPDWRDGIEAYHALFDQRDGALYVEASTGHTFYPHFNLAIWDDLFAYNPRLRFIYLVRDPIDRIVSHYMHIHERGYTDRTLEEAVRTIPLLINNTRYHAQILPFIERFGRDRVLILDLADLTNDPARTMERIAAFTGLAAGGFPSVAIHGNPSLGGHKVHHRFDDPSHWARRLRRVMPAAFREKVWRGITRNTGRGFDVKPVLSPAWKQAVMRLLELDVLALEKLMARDLSSWWEHAGLRRPDQRLG